MRREAAELLGSCRRRGQPAMGLVAVISGDGGARGGGRWNDRGLRRVLRALMWLDRL